MLFLSKKNGCLQENDAVLFLSFYIDEIFQDELIKIKYITNVSIDYQSLLADRYEQIVILFIFKNKINFNNGIFFILIKESYFSNRISELNDYNDLNGINIQTWNQNFLGYFINIFICDKCFHSNFNLEQFSFLFLDNKSTNSSMENMNEIGVLVENYFSPLSIEGGLECDKCSYSGISRVLKFIFKSPKTMLISFLDFKSLFRHEVNNIIKFKPFRELDFNKYLFSSILNKNTIKTNINEEYINEIGIFIFDFLSIFQFKRLVTL